MSAYVQILDMVSPHCEFELLRFILDLLLQQALEIGWPIARVKFLKKSQAMINTSSLFPF